ncbi:DUF6048 family protein [Mangrovimonas aestuarii]|uniref:DUF6048 family protein n=1 Tax=Mangrovimonas aestuarii TaxID=3018443 RepID=UPI002377D36D|nr:DUF6048 family protein [Mangrovimonas aestuarii]
MKKRHTIKFTINTLLVLLFCGVSVFSQNDSLKQQPIDSVKYKLRYGLRLGVDLSKLLRTGFDDDYNGFELNGDFRITRKWFIAGELGSEEKTTSNDYLNTTSSGQYFKVGADYNAYENWYGMENMIYGGLRIGASTFKQTVNSYTVYSQNQYWTPQLSSDEKMEFNSLSALWAELIVGIKAELLHNLFVGLNVQFKYIVTQNQPTGFENLYIPGYNKTYDSGNFGFGFGYNVSYLIPFYKSKG